MAMLALTQSLRRLATRPATVVVPRILPSSTSTLVSSSFHSFPTSLASAATAKKASPSASSSGKTSTTPKKRSTSTKSTTTTTRKASTTAKKVTGGRKVAKKVVKKAVKKKAVKKAAAPKKKEVKKAVVKKPKLARVIRPPKKPMAEWQIFAMDSLNKMKDEAAREGRKIALVDMQTAMRRAGDEYKLLSDVDKAVLAERVAEGRRQYVKDLEAFQASVTPDQIRKENLYRAQQRKAGKSSQRNFIDPNRPKKPNTSYFQFVQQVLSDPERLSEIVGDEKSVIGRQKLMAQRWRSMTDQEKEPYISKSREDFARYEAAKTQYEASHAA